MKKDYQTPEIGVITLRQEGMLCASDLLESQTGALWETEDGSDVEFVY